MIEVHTGEPNASSGKPLLCLHEKQVPFVHHYVDLDRREQHQPAFLAINPAGTVPALVHDGLVLTESTPMMEYIDDAFAGPRLRPADPALRWRMRWILRVLDTSVSPALAMIAAHALVVPRFRETSEEETHAALGSIPDPARRRAWELVMHDAVPPGELAESRRRVAGALALLERMLGEHPYLAGREFSLADIGAMASFFHLPVSRPGRVSRRTPNLWAWLARCHARPGLQAGFAMGRGPVAERAREARCALGLAA